MKNIKLKSKLMLGFGIILTFLVVISGVTYMSVNSLLEISSLVDHTYKVIAKGNVLGAAMVDQETGVRGFLAAGVDDFLEPYHNGKKTFSKVIAELKQTVSDNPVQVRRLEEVETLASDWLKNYADVQIDLRREVIKGASATVHLKEVRGRIVGKQIFDEFRQVLSEMESKFATAENLEGQYLMQSLLLDMVNMETGQRGFLLSGQEESLEPYRKGQTSFKKQLADLYKFDLTSAGISDSAVDKLDELSSVWQAKAANPEISARRDVNKVITEMDDVVSFMQKGLGKQYMDSLRVKLNEFIDEEAKLLGVRAAAAEATANRTVNTAIFGTLLALLVGGFISFFLARAISEPIVKGVQLAEEIAKGDFSKRLNLNRGDEIGQLAKALDGMSDNLQKNADIAEQIADGNLNVEVILASEKDQLGTALKNMTKNLNDILGEVQVAGEQIASASTQVSDASQSLSQGATESAASLEEISASLNETSSQTTVNAENAATARGLSEETKRAAEKGSAQMQEMVAAMTDINEAGQNISKIIKTIDEIAFQTNLLALNAAVEAARAGQHGKGFAVVAEEVRNLAARSAKAAAETAELIEGSVEKTANGSVIANQTAEALQEIVTGVGKVTDLVAEIAASSQEQAQGVAEINQGVSQIDTVTQQNTASAEESAAAAEELSAQAAQLRHMLQRFTLKHQSTAPPVAQTKNMPSSPPPHSSGWDGIEKSQKVTPIKSQQQITLDDGEFGKY